MLSASNPSLKHQLQSEGVRLRCVHVKYGDRLRVTTLHGAQVSALDADIELNDIISHISWPCSMGFSLCWQERLSLR
jgi:hypothetical protein